MENTRDFLSKDVSSLLKSFVESADINDEFSGYYSGKVVDNQDPSKLGRCRIRVYGIFENSIPDEDLPWCEPDFQFVGSTIGSFVVPPINAIVRVYFDNGDIYFPHYTTKVIDKNKLSSKRLEDYPDTMIIFETDEGDYLTFNRKTKRFNFHHSSGNDIEMMKNGDTNIKIKGDKDQTVDGDEMHLVKGDHMIKNNGTALTEAYISIDKTGKIIVYGSEVVIDHSISLEETGKFVVPSNEGPMNSIPVDPLTGLPHAGNICF